MLRLPVIEGLIKRRLLINFRADPEVVQRILPPGFRPKLHVGKAIVGICLIRLEQIRPKGLPAFLGASSENAAHRIAVEWLDGDGICQEGVFIPRRDTGSALNALTGGRIFPGEHHRARFAVRDDGRSVSLSMRSADGVTDMEVVVRETDVLPQTSSFASPEEASAFFENGCIGYSARCNSDRLDGIELKTLEWKVRPLEVTVARSAFFENESRFPAASIQFDHGLIMRDIPHEWQGMSEYTAVRASV